MPPETAVAVREEHPIIQKIDDKMPEIAAMLPEGMKADRFRRVVVQALVRNPDLWRCTPVSVVSAIVEAAQIGLEPTGVLGRAWMLPYAGEAKLIVGYRGYAELAWRADRILVKTGAVRDGDEFAYQRGTDAFLHHVPASEDPEREADDDNITDFWALYQLPDGRTEFEVMSRKAVERIRDKAKYKNPVWKDHFGEMGRKTVLRRLLKVAPLSPEVQHVLGRDEEIDFDTPVARVADERANAARERITQRTDALRAGREEAPVTDVWMREIHGKANKRGVDHDRLHEWAVKKFGVESLTELSASQRADMTLALEALPLIEQPAQVPDAAEGSDPAPAAKPTVEVGPSQSENPGANESSAEGRPEADVSPSSAPAEPTLADVLAVTGGEELPSEHGSAGYAEWFHQQPREKRMELQAQKLGPTDKPKRKTAPDPEPISAGLA